MKNKLIIGLLLLNTACGSEVDVKNVLIIGDSISLGYTPYVQDTLGSEAVITHNPANAQNTVNTLTKAAKWLKTDYDVITWNNGLWDCEETENFTTEEEYRANLVEIATLLLPSTRHLVFFTTTYIPANAYSRTPGCEMARNEIAKEVLEPMGVEVIDLWTLSRDNQDLQLTPVTKTDIHFTQDGYKVLAAFVENVIRERLN